jgi:hypothetical protein
MEEWTGRKFFCAAESQTTTNLAAMGVRKDSPFFSEEGLQVS